MITLLFPMSFVRWLGYGFLNKPFPFNSPGNCFGMNSVYIGPFRQRFSFSKCFNKPATSSVSGLLFPGRPKAIIGLVVSVIVSTFKAVLGRRAVAHVFKKRFKAVAPSIANLNAPTAVMAENLAIGVQAPLSHAGPNAVDRCASHAVRSGAVSGPGARSITSAGLAIATSKRFSAYRFFIAAIALAKPHGAPLSAAEIVLNALDNDQSPKSLACDIDKSAHHAVPSFRGGYDRGARNTTVPFIAHISRYFHLPRLMEAAL